MVDIKGYWSNNNWLINVGQFLYSAREMELHIAYRARSIGIKLIIMEKVTFLSEIK